jgi:prepilin-type N-terminal cleavage/methylation domain-containing protein
VMLVRRRFCELNTGPARTGMTLLEVLLALAILLFSIATISQLFNNASDQAVDIQMKSRATRLAQSKLAEFTAGVVSLSTGGSGDFSPQEPDFSWSANASQQGSAQNLWALTVTVSSTKPGNSFQTSLTQYILDPKQKGTIATTINTSSSPSKSSSNSNSNSNSTTTTQQQPVQAPVAAPTPSPSPNPMKTKK